MKRKTKIVSDRLYFPEYQTVLLTIIILTMNGCGYFQKEELKAEDLVGTYVGCYDLINKNMDAKEEFYEGWIHRLELKNDGTYVFLYIDVNGREISYSGEWEYPAFKNRKSSDPRRLILNGFGTPYDILGAPGSWITNVYKDRTGRIRIVIDGSRSFYLIKNNIQ